MLDHCKPTVQTLFFGCLVCLVVTSVVNADGRVFVLDMRNSSGLQGFRDAERACASRHARLASSAELRHAVVECFFSACTRGWLYGGTVGTTVCNVVGGVVKAVDVRTENATEDTAHLDAFCIKDKGVPCGDPPSFPNARLQGHSGYEMGDELLYTCVPGYVMPSGHSAFSLLCDSCGEWYGLVEICVKDETESHVDYEDKFIDSYGEAEHHTQRPEEAHGEVHEELHRVAHSEGKSSQEQQETSFSVEVEDEHQDQHEEPDVQGEVIGRKYDSEERETEDERAVGHYIGHPTWEQGRREVVTTDVAAATEAPVSLLSQKHLFWFPSEAFQDEGHPVSTNPATQTTQRASGAQSEESKENESQERYHHQHPVDHHDHEPDSYDDHDRDDQYDHDNSDHDNQDAHDNSHHDDQDDHDSHQDEDNHDDHGKHYIPAEGDDLDRLDRHESHEDHDDHYDMGEHEENRDRIRYESQDYDDRDDTYDEHESYEDHKDVIDDREHPDVSKEHPEHDDDEEHYDTEEDDQHNDHDDHDHDDQDHDDHDHDDQDHDDHGHDDHDSHEDVDGGHQHVIFSIAADERQNVTQRGEGEATTDETWLDGYPVHPKETDNGGSTNQRVRPEDREGGAVVRTTDKPNEVEVRRPGSYTSLPEAPESASIEPVLEQDGTEEMWPGFIPTTAPSADHAQSQPSDFPSYFDALDYDTQQVAPTRSWLEDLTEDPFLHHDLAPPVKDGDILMEEHTLHNLPGETGQRGEIEGEMGETICTGEDCPPPGSSSRGPTVAAIIVVVCAVAAAVIVGLWCYRRQQQKSSMYEMNGKGQSQTRQGQQIEMQQKV